MPQLDKDIKNLVEAVEKAEQEFQNLTSANAQEYLDRVNGLEIQRRGLSSRLGEEADEDVRAQHETTLEGLKEKISPLIEGAKKLLPANVAPTPTPQPAEPSAVILPATHSAVTFEPVVAPKQNDPPIVKPLPNGLNGIGDLRNPGSFVVKEYPSEHYSLSTHQEEKEFKHALSYTPSENADADAIEKSIEQMAEHYIHLNNKAEAHLEGASTDLMVKLGVLLTNKGIAIVSNNEVMEKIEEQTSKKKDEPPTPGKN